MTCQFCGAGESDRNEAGSWVGFDCGSTWRKGLDPRKFTSRYCELKEVENLRAKITALKDAGDALFAALAYPPMVDLDEIAEVLKNWDKAKGANETLQA